MNIEDNETIMTLMKESVLDRVLVEDSTYGISLSDAYDAIINKSSDGMGYSTAHKVIKDLLPGVRVANSYETAYFTEFQEMLKADLYKATSNAQSLFNVVIPKNIELRSEGGYLANSLIVDSEFQDNLPDEMDTEPPSKNRVKINSLGIDISVDGFGSASAGDNLDSSVILIEKADKQVRALMWGDINNEDFTDLIELSDDARMENRVEDDFSPGR